VGTSHIWNTSNAFPAFTRAICKAPPHGWVICSLLSLIQMAGASKVPTYPPSTNRNETLEEHMLLELGAKGDAVRRLQILLNDNLRPSPQLRVDAHFGVKTESAALEHACGSRALALRRGQVSRRAG
jgi:hypothetical protein